MKRKLQMKGQHTSNYSILNDASSRTSFLGHIRAVCFHSDTRHASFRIHHTAVRSLGCTREDETETVAVTFGRNDVDTFRVHTSLCDTNRETTSTWLVYVCARAPIYTCTCARRFISCAESMYRYRESSVAWTSNPVEINTVTLPRWKINRFSFYHKIPSYSTRISVQQLTKVLQHL